MRLSQGIYLTSSVDGTIIDGYSTSTDIVSNPINLKHVYGYSMSVSWSGNPSGTWQIECCNDSENPKNATPDGLIFPGLSNWVVVANSGQLASAGAAISPATNPCLTWNYSNAMYRFVRLHYIRVSGTQQVTARLQMKAGE